MIDYCSDNSAKYDRIKVQNFSNAVRHNTKGKTMKFANIGGNGPKKPPSKEPASPSKTTPKKKC